MVRYIVLTLIILAVAGSIQGQEEDTLFRAVKAEPSIESFRPVGDARTWVFYARQTTFGRLISTVRETRQINGRPAVVIQDDLSIDYNLIGTERRIDVKGEFFQAKDGSYLGCDLAIGPDTAFEKLVVELDGENLEGYYTRAGRQVDVDVPMERDILPWEMYFVDQLEIFLAMQDLEVGTVIDDTVFSPQIMMSSRIVGEVTRWMWQEIYEGKIDSVFIIRLTEPADYQLYFTADKRLVRVDMETHNIRVYQGQIRNTIPTTESETAASTKPDSRNTLRLMFLKSPHYAAFLVIGLLSVLLMTRSGFKRLNSWLAFIIGGVAFIIIPYTQIPLQIYVVSSWLIPNINEGGSIFFWSVFPAGVAGLFQTLFVLGLLTALFFWRRVRRFNRAAVGAFLGAGFALIEASYVSGLKVSYLFTPILVERAFFILFHVVSGTLIGTAIGKGTERLSITLILVFLVNSCLRYVPIFVQQEKLTVPMMSIVMGFICLVFLVYALITLRSDTGEPAS